MGQNIVLTGMVLQVMPMGEYDKRITVLTKERGKITAFARGARRPVSQLLAATSPFSFGEFEFFEGRSTYNLAKASIANYFRELSEDPVKACYGFYFLEVADFYAQENSEEKELLKLLYQTLRALGKGTLDARLVRRVYEFRVLLAEGEYPNFFSCQNCGETDGLACFSVRRHGMLCRHCTKEKDGIPLDGSTLYTLQYIFSAELTKLYTFTVSDHVLDLMERIADRIYADQVPHSFRSLEILKTIAG